MFGIFGKGCSLPALATLAAIGAAAFVAPAQAQPVVAGGNGGFSTFTGGTTAGSNTQMTNTNTSGWQTTSGYSFILSTSDFNNFVGPAGALGLAAGIVASPNGGNFLAQDSGYLTGATTTTVTGLVVGTHYNLSFYQAATMQTGYVGATNDTWNVSINGAAATAAPTMSIASQGWSGWTQINLAFIATAASETLSFLASTTTPGLPPFALLDGVSVTQSVPEPATSAMLLSGLVGLLGLRRAKRAQG